MQLNTLTPTMTVSPQIRPEDVSELAARGFKTIISNSPDGEEPGQPTAAEIAAAAEAAGLTFHHIPFSSGGLTPEAMAEFETVMADAETPVFAFCRSGTRSCVLWSLTQAKTGARDLDEILKCASDGGYDLSAQRGLLERMAGG